MMVMWIGSVVMNKLNLQNSKLLYFFVFITEQIYRNFCINQEEVIHNLSTDGKQ
jgi:hypothetical protein